MTLYVENPKGTTRKLLINELGKVNDTQLIHRNLLNSYKLRRKEQKENKETIPLTMATNKNKMFLRRQNIYTHKTLRYS